MKWQAKTTALIQKIEILFVNSDASYLTALGSKNHASGFFYLGNNDKSVMDGSISYVSTIIKNVMASAVGVDKSALFFNTRLAIPLRIILIEMDHP